jgi:hypothetical protein
MERGGVWKVYLSIVRDNLFNEALLVAIYVRTTLHHLSSNVLILIDGMSLTSTKFDRSLVLQCII